MLKATHTYLENAQNCIYCETLAMCNLKGQE